MSPTSRTRMTGIGRVLVVVYAIMALAATGRSLVQIVERDILIYQQRYGGAGRHGDVPMAR